MISLVGPIRGRYEDTLRTLKSAYELASSPENVEVLFRVDDDDRELIDRKWPRYPNLNFYKGGRMLGYGSLHIMLNDMAVKAKGDFILNISNDVRFLTKNWDEEYYKFIDKCHGISVVHVKKTKDNTSGTQFPAITKKLFDILGHFSLSPSIDDYITFVGLKARCMFHSEVLVEHDYTKDEIAGQKESRVPFMKQEFFQEPMQNQIIEDAKKLSMFIGEYEMANWAKENFG